MPIPKFKQNFRNDKLLHELASRLETACVLDAASSDAPGFTASQFWEQIYCPRTGEYEDFAAFLCKKKRPIVLVTGHAGAGKSTYIAEKLCNPARLAQHLNGEMVSCQGITIDLGDLTVEAQDARSKASD